MGLTLASARGRRAALEYLKEIEQRRREHQRIARGREAGRGGVGTGKGKEARLRDGQHLTVGDDEGPIARLGVDRHAAGEAAERGQQHDTGPYEETG